MKYDILPIVTAAERGDKGNAALDFLHWLFQTPKKERIAPETETSLYEDNIIINYLLFWTPSSIHSYPLNSLISTSPKITILLNLV